MKFRNALAITALTLSFAAAPAAAAEIASHEAVYRLTLKDLRIEGWSDTAGGILQLKLYRNCSFWMLDRKLEFRIKFTDGRRTHLVVNEKIRESIDGERLWFWSRTTVNGGTASIITGQAARLITIKPEKKEVVEEEVVEEGDEGPTLEDLVATPEELAKKAAEEAAKKAEEDAKAEKSAKDDDAMPEGETSVAEGEDGEKISEGEAVKAAEVGPVEIEMDGDSLALATAAAEAAAEAEKTAAEATANADSGKDPETETAILVDENGNPVLEVEEEEPGRVASIISYDWPDGKDVEIPLDTIFPFTALQAQLDALSSGSLQRSFTVFDGTSPNGALRVLYAPVRTVAIASIKPKGSVELLETTSWRYSATYMNTDGKSNKPARIVIAQTHQNGVVSEMILDLGPFSIKGDLAWVKATTSPVCE